MRILIISFSNQYTLQETTLLMQNYYDTYENEVYTMTSSVEIFKSFNHTEKNFFVKCPPSPGFSVEAYRSKEFKQVIQIIERINPTNIFFYSSHIWNIRVMNHINKSIKTTHMIHDILPHDRFIKKILINQYNTKVVHMVDSVVVHSKAYLSIALEKYKFDKDKIKYMPILRRFEGITPLQYTGNFLFFGRISKYKGIKHLVEIVKECSNCKFLIIGKFSDDVIKYKYELMKHSNVYIDDKYVSEEKMKEYIKKSDWLILPYIAASQSGVIPDAYVNSRPVITFNVGNIYEQVTNKTGFLIERNNLDQFIRTILICSKMDKDEHKSYSTSAYEYGLQNYSFDSNYVQFISLFHDSQNI